MRLAETFQFWLLESNDLEEVKFNPDVLDKMDGPESMLSAARDKLPALGEGSSRAAFLLDSKRVLKVAINNKGLAQNKAEYELSQHPGVAPLVTRIFRVGKDYSWLVSELVRPLRTNKEFEQLTQVPWSFFISFLSFYEGNGDIGKSFNLAVKSQIDQDRRKKSPFPGISVRRIEHLPFIGRFMTALGNRPDLIPADLMKLDHWGKTPDQRVVLLDSGYTEEVWSSHYSDES